MTTRIKIGTENGELNASLTVGFLKSKGILAFTCPNSSDRRGSTALSPFAIFVNQTDADRASKILNDRDAKSL